MDANWWGRVGSGAFRWFQHVAWLGWVALAAAAVLLSVTGWRARRRSPADDGSRTWWRTSLIIVVPIFVVTAVSLVAMFLTLHPDPHDRIEVVKTGLSVGAGAGGVVALVLAGRRQWATEHDSAERRITELYSKAADQLGFDKEPVVRLASLYALERLAQDYPAHRQTIVNIICAYLRMPFTPPAGDAQPAARGLGLRARHQARPASQRDLGRREDLQVRLTAQQILTNHLKPTAAGRWRRWLDVDLDLTGATLVDFDLAGCAVDRCRFTGARFRGATSFAGTTFEGAATFEGAEFLGDATFARAVFQANADLSGVAFRGSAGFDLVTFGGASTFRAATFARPVTFGNAVFTDTCTFDDAGFAAETTFDYAVARAAGNFRRVRFTDAAHFFSAEFHGWTRFDEAEFRGSCALGFTRFHRTAHFIGTVFADDARFSSARFDGPVEVADSQFFGQADFDGTRFLERAQFTGATFAGPVDFTGVGFRRAAGFHHAFFYGPVQLPGAGATFDFDGVRIRDAAVARTWPTGWVEQRVAVAGAPDTWRTLATATPPG